MAKKNHPTSIIVLALKKLGISASSAQASLWSLLDSLAGPVFTILMIPVLTSQIGLKGYGTYVLIMTCASVLSFSSLGMNTAVTYFGAEKKTDKQQTHQHEILLGSALIIAAAGVLLISMISMITIQVMESKNILNLATLKEYNDNYIYAVILVFFTQLDLICAALLKSQQYFKQASIVELSLRSLNFIVVMVTVIAYKNINELIITLCALSIFNFIVRLIYIQRIKILNIGSLKANRVCIVKLLQYGKWMSLQNISGLIFTNLDKLLLGVFYGAQTVGAYNIIITIVQQIHFVLSSASSFMMPKIMQTSETKTQQKQQYYRVIKISTVYVVIAATALTIAGAPLLRYFAMEKLHNEYYISLLAFSILACCIPPYYYSLGLGKLKSLSNINIISAMLGSLTILVLVPYYGVVGAVISRLIYASAVCLTFMIPLKDFNKKITT